MLLPKGSKPRCLEGRKAKVFPKYMMVTESKSSSLLDMPQMVGNPHRIWEFLKYSGGFFLYGFLCILGSWIRLITLWPPKRLAHFQNHRKYQNFCSLFPITTGRIFWLWEGRSFPYKKATKYKPFFDRKFRVLFVNFRPIIYLFKLHLRSNQGLDLVGGCFIHNSQPYNIDFWLKISEK